MDSDGISVGVLPSSSLNEDDSSPEEFFEEAYLVAFPDVLIAIRRGDFRSAIEHYQIVGHTESRLNDPLYTRALTSFESENFPDSGLDAIFFSQSGRAFVIGWINDIDGELSSITVGDYNASSLTKTIARCRRQDAEEALGIAPSKHLGFWAVLENARKPKNVSETRIVMTLGRRRRSLIIIGKILSDEQFHHTVLEYIALQQYFGNRQIDTQIELEKGGAAVITRLNKEISSNIITQAHAIRFGKNSRHFVASIIVCLYGKPEFLFLQAATFSASRGYSTYEFIYVSNSPELAESLCKEADLAAKIYDLSITLVLLPGNAGFGAANNVAAAHARSQRIMIVNPDVFPQRPDWAAAHAAIVDNLPDQQTRMFGVSLFYNDGSLMHGGMYFEIDQGVSIGAARLENLPLIRVEHYGKGAPPDSLKFRASRPVPAVTGAFISTERKWFESLGGFSLDYVFGHYEDADLCLKSYQQGYPVWMHDLPFWHLEGKGSTRQVVHEGGSLVNRWNFRNRWTGLIRSELLGSKPPKLAI